jgi:hypothetical protein
MVNASRLVFFVVLLPGVDLGTLYWSVFILDTLRLFAKQAAENDDERGDLRISVKSPSLDLLQ